MPTILADENIPLVDALFGQLGTVITMPGRNIKRQHLRGIDILLVRSVTRVDSDLLQGSDVQFVGSCTIGKDHMDIDYLNRMAIRWANAPGCNADAVVQYVLSTMATLAPRWADGTVGIIGCGNVGGHLLHCLRIMGVKCLCYDPLIEQDRPELTTLRDVLTADIISCHTPLTTTGPFPTYHLISENELNQLAPETLFINTSRGAVVDNAALVRLLQQQHSLKVALDVWEGEPEIDLELLEQVDIGTPHIAGHSLDGKQQGSVQVYQALCRHLDTDTGDLAGLLSSNQKKILTPARKDDIHAQRNAILLAAYDINNDDQRLRHGYRQQNEPMPVFFDRLRRNYPVRRDYSHCVLPAWLDNYQHRYFLKALGLKTLGAKGTGAKDIEVW